MLAQAGKAAESLEGLSGCGSGAGGSPGRVALERRVVARAEVADVAEDATWTKAPPALKVHADVGVATLTVAGGGIAGG